MAGNPNGKSREIVLDYQELVPSSTPELFLADGRPRERIRGRFLPRRIRFLEATWDEPSGLYERLETVPLDSPARLLFGMFHLRTTGGKEFYFLMSDSDEPASAFLQAAAYRAEPRAGDPEPIEVVRPWSHTPGERTAIYRLGLATHRAFGGDPISVRIGRRSYLRRLFIGSLNHQGDRRPDVDAVLNVADTESRWVESAGRHAADRRSVRGEGAMGMSVGQLAEEAAWVVERLRAGRRVLVHCSGGRNRSASICCAALMRLEGISPEEALARVREHHPWAWPDPYHWLALRWMGRDGKKQTN